MIINLDLTKLSTQNIVDLLESAGYNESSSDVIRATFNKVTNDCSNSIQYTIEYYDIDDNLCSDYVYVSINRDGKLTADY